MSKFNKNQVVYFKIGSLEFLGQILNVITLDFWQKDSSGNPIKAQKFNYQIMFDKQPFLKIAEVEEKDIISYPEYIFGRF